MAGSGQPADLPPAGTPTGAAVTFDLPDDRDRRHLTTLLRATAYGCSTASSPSTWAISTLDRLLAASTDRFTGGGHLPALPSCPDCETARYGVPLEVFPEQGWTGW